MVETERRASNDLPFAFQIAAMETHLSIVVPALRMLADLASLRSRAKRPDYSQ
ncbi:hypothetical protein [Candidatus Binatus sp.]|uniref:hypothetical protein n=1 Tax=Candidatus Binatus sp. TaxID=2811406 RepID=UPI003C838C93